MTASFPRNWQYTTSHNGDGVIPAITIPAIAGIAHVLTSVDVHLVQYGTTAVSPIVYVQTPIGTNVDLRAMALSANTGDSTDLTESQNLTGAPGAGMSVTVYMATPAGVWCDLTVQGYDY